MKYKITSNKSFKLNYWFLREGDYGVSLEYLYRSNANVTLDHSFINPGQDGEEQFNDQIISLIKSINSRREWTMTYPAPYYFLSPLRSAIWDKPDFENIKAPKKTLLIDPKNFQLKIDLQNRKKNLTRWSIWDSRFKWINDKFSKANDKQINSSYKSLAKIWNSECWRAHESLIKYMGEELNLDLDENEAEFTSPTLSIIE